MKVRCINPIDGLVFGTIYEARQCSKRSDFFRITTKDYENGGFKKDRFEIIDELDNSYGAVYYNKNSEELFILVSDERGLIVNTSNGVTELNNNYAIQRFVINTIFLGYL